MHLPRSKPHRVKWYLILDIQIVSNRARKINITTQVLSLLKIGTCVKRFDRYYWWW